MTAVPQPNFHPREEAVDMSAAAYNASQQENSNSTWIDVKMAVGGNTMSRIENGWQDFGISWTCGAVRTTRRGTLENLAHVWSLVASRRDAGLVLSLANTFKALHTSENRSIGFEAEV